MAVRPCQEYEDEWTEELLRAQPAAALAALLASSGSAAAYPLRFGVSSEDLDEAAGIAGSVRARGDDFNSNGLLTLRAYADPRLTHYASESALAPMTLHARVR